MQHDGTSLGLRKPIASLSLDLDNKWSYMKTRGAAHWQSYPSYIDLVAPRVLEVMRDQNLTITVFVVGQDAALPRNRAALRSFAEAGHEVGNHSFSHEPWLHLYSEGRIEDEIASAEEHIERATGCIPAGFRGPGYSLSEATLRVLVRRGYRYDASTFPTVLGPLARAYYLMTSDLSPKERQKRGALFGNARDGARPLKAYRWRIPGGGLIEIPVTTMPGLRTPIHVSYLLYLSAFAPTLAMAYFRSALTLCRMTGTELSLLLHPLDFLGAEDAQPELAFFPAMALPREAKLSFVVEVLAAMGKSFHIVPMGKHAQHAAQRPDLATRRPDFRQAPSHGMGAVA